VGSEMCIRDSDIWLSFASLLDETPRELV